MDKKINILDVALVFLFLLVCLALTVSLIMYFSENEKIAVYRISVGDDTAEIIKPGDIVYDPSGAEFGKVVAIGSLGRQKTIDIKAEKADAYRIGENVGFRTQRIFLKGTVYSVNLTEEESNEK